ncbi:hypothetical protein GGF32_007744, partial [Allomyces javanicus]
MTAPNLLVQGFLFAVVVFQEMILPTQRGALIVAFKITTSQATWGSACAVVGSRLYAFAGSIGVTGANADVTTNGIYSIDLNRTITTGVGTDLQVHGTLGSESEKGFRNQIAFVRPDDTVFLLGGRYNSSVAEDFNGNFSVEVAYLFDTKTDKPTKPNSKAEIPYHPSWQYRTVGYKNRYLIHVGGISPSKQYALVEYMDLTTNEVRIGTIDNASDGPESLTSGCMHMEDDVIVYLGGYEPIIEGKSGEEVLAAFVNLLQ